MASSRLRPLALLAFASLSLLAVLPSSKPADHATLRAKLNGQLPRELLSQIHETRETPDGSHLLYRATGEHPSIISLYAVGPTGQPHRISPLNPLGSINAFAVSPDSTQVAFVVNDLFDDSYVWVARVDGSQPAVRVAPALRVYEFSPDSQSLLFEQSVGADSRLASVNVSGGAPSGGSVLLSSIPTLRGLFAPGGLTVLFEARQAPYLRSLFSVPADASLPEIDLSGTMVPDASARFLSVTPGGLVIYQADALLAGRTQAFSVPLDGSSPPVLLSGGPLASDKRASQTQLTSDGQYVVFATTGDAKLFRTLPDGSEDPTLLAELDEFSMFFVVSPDSVKVAYTDGDERIFSVPVDGSQAPTLLVSEPTGLQLNLNISPDSTTVVYSADHAPGLALRLYAVSIAGGPVRQLSVPEHPIMRFTLEPSSTYVVYEEGSFSTPDVHSVRIDGTTPPVQLNANEGAFFPTLVNLDGESVRFVTLDPTTFRQTLRTRRIDGSGPLEVVRTPFAFRTTGEVQHVFPTPDGSRVLYLANQRRPSWLELFSAPVDGSAPAARLSPNLPPFARVGDNVVLEPDGEHVLFWIEIEQNDHYELYRAPVDGSSPAVPFSGLASSVGDNQVLLDEDGDTLLVSVDLAWVATSPDGSTPEVMVGSSALQNESVTPDGAWLLATANIDADPGRELVAIAIDGTTMPPPARLDTGTDETIDDYAIDADGTGVVFASRTWGTARRTLHHAALDGSGVTPLSNTLGPDQSVVDFRVGANGSIVYSVADAAGDVNELHAVPVLGAPSTRLTPPFVQNGAITSPWQLDPTGHFAVYKADQNVRLVRELYAVPTDGSTATVKLSPPLHADGDVATEFVLTSDGTRAVFRTDHALEDINELFVATLDGQSGPLLLNGTLVEDGNVESFHVRPDGREVVYIAEQDQVGIAELYVAPLDGSGRSARLSPAGAFSNLHEGVIDATFTPDSRFVLYVGDLESWGSKDLYSTRNLLPLRDAASESAGSATSAAAFGQ